MNQQFWQAKKVLITGHTGFKGTWLALWLSKLGAEVAGFSLAPENGVPSMFDLCGVESAISRSTLGDIRDRESLKSSLRQFRPDIVFHLAAQSLVRRSYANPAETFETNVIGTVNLFEAIRAIDSVRAVVNVTTDKCYRNQEWVWGYRETDPLGGYDPYSASKACSEIISASYRQSFFDTRCVGVATARAGNVIGGGDWSSDRLIPDLVRAMQQKENLAIRNPTSVRPWQHVLEPLSGYLLLAERLYGYQKEFADAWNFGPPAAGQQTVEWVVGEFARLFGKPWARTAPPGNQPHETNVLTLDSTKAARQLGWSPRLTLEEGVRWTASWYLAWDRDPQMLKEFTFNQIADYATLPALGAAI